MLIELRLGSVVVECRSGGVLIELVMALLGIVPLTGVIIPGSIPAPSVGVVIADELEHSALPLSLLGL